jgi:DNA-binding GntR family transcriptional regulator
MSLTPVREAIRALEAEGLLSGSSHKTLRVADVNADEAREIYAVRAVLEESATALAVPHLTAEDVLRLEALVAKMGLACRRGQPRRYRRLDEQFHMALYRRSGNRLLYASIDDLWSRYPRDVLWTIPGRLRDSHVEHGRILRAIKAADARTAGVLMRAHILNAMDGVARFLARNSLKRAVTRGPGLRGAKQPGRETEDERLRARARVRHRTA